MSREEKMRYFILFSILLSLSIISCGKRRHKYEHARTPDFVSDISIDKLNNHQTKVAIDKMFILVRNNTQLSRKVHLICRSLDGCLHICDHFNHDNFDHANCKQLSAKQVINFWINKMSEYRHLEQAKKDLRFIATNKDVANFIKVIDKDGRVMRTLFRLSSEAMCPIAGNLAVRHTPLTSLYLTNQKEAEDKAKEVTEEETVNVAEDASVKDKQEVAEDSVDVTAEDVAKEPDTKDSIATTENAIEDEKLAVPPTNEENEAQDVAEEPIATNEDVVTKPVATEVAEDSVDVTAEDVATEDTDKHIALHSEVERKKIIDGSVTPFDFPIFFSFIKKCFGTEPVRTFTQLAVEIENRSAFEIAHQVLTEACSNNSECIRLAYCNMDSELVWDQLDEKYKQLGCSYNSFVENPLNEESPVTKKQ